MKDSGRHGLETAPRAKRPTMDAIEVRAPGLAALMVRLLMRMPEGVRRRVLNDAFGRAARAFNRADFASVCALFADGVEYVPPPALYSGEPIIGRTAVLEFWFEVSRR